MARKIGVLKDEQFVVTISTGLLSSVPRNAEMGDQVGEFTVQTTHAGRIIDNEHGRSGPSGDKPLKNKLRPRRIGTKTNWDVINQLYNPLENREREIMGVPLTKINAGRSPMEQTAEYDRRRVLTPDGDGTFSDNDWGFSRNYKGDTGDYRRMGSPRQRNSRPNDIEKAVYQGDQLFPFLFEADETNNNGLRDVIYLQGTLISLNEQFTSQWSNQLYFGRTEQVYLYSVTERAIDISFTVFANSRDELPHVKDRVQWFAQHQYPTVEEHQRNLGVQRLNQGPIVRMTIGDLYYRLPGIIQSVTLNWDRLGQGGGIWELDVGKRMPIACDITIRFTVLHEEMPHANKDFYPALFDEARTPMRQSLSPLNSSSGPGGMTPAYARRFRIRGRASSDPIISSAVRGA